LLTQALGGPLMSFAQESIALSWQNKDIRS
jgi:hypothetical protein